MPPSGEGSLSTSRPGERSSFRYERRGKFTLNGSAEDVFPLLCPVIEYAWLPGWKCRMAHSDSGAAEDNCVFLTREAPGRTALWTCVTYEPPTFIEYLVFGDFGGSPLIPLYPR